MGNSTAQRQQRILLNGDDILDPSLFTPDNADASIQGISENASGSRTWAVDIGGTGNGSFTDRMLLYYDQQTNTLRSSGITIEDIRNLQSQLMTVGPLVDQCKTAQGTQGSWSATVPVSAQITLPANAQWVWFRVYMSVFLANNSGNDLSFPITTLTINDLAIPSDWLSAGAVRTGNPTIWDSLLTASFCQWEGQTLASLVATAQLTFKAKVENTGLSMSNLVLSVVGYYRLKAGYLPPAQDPDIVPLPPNWTVNFFQLQYPGPDAAGALNSNLEYSIGTFNTGQAVNINWGSEPAYLYALKVLHTLEVQNSGKASDATNAARTWLQTVYSPGTALTTLAFPVTVPAANYPAGVATIQAGYSVDYVPVNGAVPAYYKRTFTLKTLTFA